MAQHLHMKHLDSFSFTSFSKNIYNFIIPPTSNHYHRFDWLLNSSCQQQSWNAFCVLVVSFETTTQEYHDFKSHCTQQPQRWPMSPHTLPAYRGELEEMPSLLLDYLFVAVLFSRGCFSHRCEQANVYAWYFLSDNYVQNILKIDGSLGICISSFEESYFEVFFFFLSSCKQKERDIHRHVSTYIEIYTEYFQCGIYLLIQRYTQTQSECPHSPLHTYPHPYTQHGNTNVVRVLGSSLEFVCYQMVMKYLICITPEKVLEGNDSSDALWNGTIT